MRLLADMHISPRTVRTLRVRSHDVVRVSDIMPATSTDEAVVARAIADSRVILTQDLRFSAILAVTGAKAPSLISLRLSSSRVEFVDGVLDRVLPEIEREAMAGAIITVEDTRVRVRRLPVA